MMYPNSKIIQDNGYELINVNGKAILSPLRRGKIFFNDYKKNGIIEIVSVDALCF